MLIANFMNNFHVRNACCSYKARMHSLSESRRGSKVTKPILVIPSVAAKCVHVRKKTCCNWRQT